VDKWHRAFLSRLYRLYLPLFHPYSCRVHGHGQLPPCGGRGGTGDLRGYIRRAPATVEQSAGRQEEEKREGEEYFPPSWNQSGSGEVHGDEDWRWRIGDAGLQDRETRCPSTVEMPQRHAEDLGQDGPAADLDLRVSNVPGASRFKLSFLCFHHHHHIRQTTLL